jgi:predicted nucleic acid-binding protein
VGCGAVILADTTVVIDILRGRDETQQLLERFLDEPLCISGITIKELHVGLGYTRVKMNEAVYEEKRRDVLKLIEDFHVIEVSNEILEKAGEKEGELLAKGKKLELEDIIVGISAEDIKASRIITRNADHFTPFSIPVESYQITTKSRPGSKK